MTERLTAGVVGLGRMGRHHARLYRDLEGVTLVGVVDVDPEIARNAGKDHAVAHFGGITRFVDEVAPKLVSVAVPTADHFTVAKQLIERGIHVLVEKPIAETVEQARALVECARERGVVLAVGHIERFNPAIVELKRLLTRGVAGELRQVHARRLSPRRQRSRDAGVVLDLASHDIDLMRHLVAAPVAHVSGESSATLASGRPDVFHGVVRFHNGVLGILDANWITLGKSRDLTVIGTTGAFTCDLLSQELSFRAHDAGRCPGDAGSEWNTPGSQNGRIHIERLEPLRAELSNFIAAAKHGREPAISGAEGLASLELTLALAYSANEFQAIAG